MSSDDAGLAAADNMIDDDLGRLVISRYIGQTFSVDGPATIMLLETTAARGGRAWFAITAPRSTIIERDNLKRKDRRDASTTD